MRNQLFSLLGLLSLQILYICGCGTGETSVCGTEEADSNDVGSGPVRAIDPSERKAAEEWVHRHFVFSPDGQYVLSGGIREQPGPRTVVLWSAEDGSYVRTVRRPEDCRGLVPGTLATRLSEAVAFSPAGDLLAIARWRSRSDYEIAIEELASGNRICTLLLRPNTMVPTIAFSDDGRYVIGSGSWVPGEPAQMDPLLDVWDAQTGERVWDPDRPVPYPLSEFERRAEALLPEVGSGRLRKTTAEADLRLLLILRNLRKDGKPLVARGTIRTHGLSHFSPDGRWLITRDGIIPGSEYDSEAVIWDAKACRLVREFDEEDIYVEPFAFSADGDLFLRRAHERPRKVYETATGKPIRSFPETPNGTILALAPNGKTAVLGTRKEAVLFDTESGRIIKSFAIEGSEPPEAKFNPDGSRLVINFCDCSVDRLNDEFHDCAVVYEVREPCPEVFRLEALPRVHGSRSFAAAYDAKGRRILYGGALWDGSTGRKIRQFRIRHR